MIKILVIIILISGMCYGQNEAKLYENLQTIEKNINKPFSNLLKVLQYIPK